MIERYSMGSVVTKLIHEEKEYAATIQRIESVETYLERDSLISISICVENACLGGWVLGWVDEDVDYLGNNTKYLYEWVHAVFQLTGATSFSKAVGTPVLAVWERDGLAGDRIIGLATTDGSFVFIPQKK